MNWLDLFITVSVGIGFVKGLFDGVIKQVISLISFILAIFFAGRLASPIRDYLLSKPIFSGIFPSYIVTGVCYVLAFSLIILAFVWLGRLLEQAIKVTPAAMMNYFLGGFLAAFKMLFILSLIFTLLTVFDPNSHTISKQTQRESVLFNRVRVIVPFLYPFLREYLERQDIIPSPKKEPEKKEILVLNRIQNVSFIAGN